MPTLESLEKEIRELTRRVETTETRLADVEGKFGFISGQRQIQDHMHSELAQQSSDAWLALTDQGKYADGYQEAAQYFKNAITKDQWEAATRASREPLGKVLSRKLKSATYTKALPGAPDGEYVVIQYDTSFEHKQSAVETVTPMLDDGRWRVSGYYIR